MKIAYFLDASSELGGAGNLLLQQAALMSELYNVIVVIPADETRKYNEEYAKRCEQHSLKYACIKYSTAVNFTLIDFLDAMHSVADIEMFARKEKVEFFHSVQLNIAVEYVSRKLKIPHLMDIYQIKEEEFKICYCDIYSHYHLCDSVLYSNMWSRQLKIKSKCVRPIALLDNIKKKARYPESGIKILMLGTVCERKNQLTAIKAVEQCFCKHKVELHIAGDIDNHYARECLSYVKERNLEHFIVFHGFVSNIRPLLEICDCLLCSSVDESFPSSMVEALTYDLTIISTPVAGVPEIFANKSNSFISRSFSEKSVKDSILECIEYYRNGEICDIHRNADQTWRNNFERSVVRRQIDLYYKEILTDNKFGDTKIFLETEQAAKKTEVLLNSINDEGEKWIHSRGLYYTFIRKQLCKGKMYIWGAGKFGRLTFDIIKRLCPDLEIIAFIDLYKEGMYCGLQVIRPEDMVIEKHYYYSISFAKDRDGAIQYLESKGLVLNSQIWCLP